MRRIPTLPVLRGHENEIVVHDHGRIGQHVHAPRNCRNATTTAPIGGSSGPIAVEIELA